MVYLDLWPSVMTINKKSGKKAISENQNNDLSLLKLISIELTKANEK